VVTGTWRAPGRSKTGFGADNTASLIQPDLLGTEECHLWEVTGNKIMATRDGGNGSSYVFAIEQ